MAGYNDHVRNLIINYEAKTGHGMAIRYIYEAADLQEAVRDHTYTKLPFTQHWVDRELQVTKNPSLILFHGSLQKALIVE